MSGIALTSTFGVDESIRLARRYSLESNYDVAVALYGGLDTDIANYIQSCDGNKEVGQWTVLRERIAEECQLVKSIQEELQALVNPSEAARLERASASESGSGGGGGVRHGAQAKVSPRAQLPSDHSERRAATVQPVHHPVGIVGQAARMGLPPPPARRVSEDLGERNKALYGDKDRFGPPKGPSLRQPEERGSEPVRAAARPKSPTPRGRVVPAKVSSPRPKVSSPRPKVSSPRAKVVTRRKKRPGDGSGKQLGEAREKIPRFTPRAGEEELVSLIEADMHVGPMPISWDDIAGQEEAKGLLEEAVVFPVLMPDYYQGIRRPWKGVLLYGPPGTGKTMLAKAVASECDTTFFNISPATLTSKWRGDSEKLIRVLFEMARYYAPSTIFIDEIDSLGGQRGDGAEHEASRRAKGTLLAQMDGVGVDPGKIVMVLGATNHPWAIDDALRRRLEKRIYIPLPNHEDRMNLFSINTKALKLSPDVDFERLSKKLEGSQYSGADITTLVRDAAMMTMRRFMEERDKSEVKKHAAEIGKMVADQPITMNDFLEALKKVPSSINVDQIKKFENWKKEFETNA